MSLSNLVGQECGESNSALKITDHFTKDIGHRQERVPYTFEDDLQKSIPTPINSNQLIHEFTSKSPLKPAQPFLMDSMLGEMTEMDRRNSMLPPVRVHPGVTHFTQPSIWNQKNFAAPVYQNQLEEVWAQEQNVQQTHNELGAAWEDSSMTNVNQLAEGWSHDLAEEQMLQQTNTVLGAAWKDSSLTNENQLVEGRSQDSAEEQKLQQTITELGAAWEKSKITNGIRLQSMANSWQYDFDPAKTTSREKGHLEDDRFYALNYRHINGNIVHDRDGILITEERKESLPTILRTRYEMSINDSLKESMTDYKKEYIFEKENDFIEHPDPLAAGKLYLEKGDIPTAILLFEAAAQKMPKNSEAWHLLGNSHAENEQDHLAIAALNNCVEIDSTKSEAWMSLCSCYANEGYYNYGCHALKQWITSKAEYRDLVTNNILHKPSFGYDVSREEMKHTISLLVAAANMRNAGNIDFDVQCGFGILLHMNEEYDRAVECFQLAVHVQPQDARLWNKLGAALANDNQPEEAVEAYRNALKLSPGFIRCRTNLAIACYSMGAHRDAISHLLEAIQMQENVKIKSNASKIVVSDNIWRTLRIFIGSLGSDSLLNAVRIKDLETLRKEFLTSSNN